MTPAQMTTLKQFKTLTEIYGGDPQRWPPESRNGAETLLAHSPEARAILDEARTLDALIQSASSTADEALWQQGTQDAALARLRSNVASQIAACSFRRSSFQRMSVFDHATAFLQKLTPDTATPFGWLGLAGSGGIAIIAGLLIGANYDLPQQQQASLTAMLMSAPITILVE